MAGEEKLSWFFFRSGTPLASGLLAHPDPPEKIGQVRHCGQDYPGDVVESETALMKGIWMAIEKAEQLYQ